ncbi:MAG: aminopeptidase P family protein [Sphingomonadaceae bacterium]|nr:aminopeptidase P family protein [Sphingomonadaceae bacterium]
MLLNESRARAVMARYDIDALVTLSPFNSYYLSGFWSKAMAARWDTFFGAVLTQDGADGCMVVPVMELANRDAITKRFNHVVGYPTSEAVDLIQAFTEALKGVGLRKGRVAAGDARLPLWLGDMDGLSCVYNPNIIKEIRLIKTEAEIALMRTAARNNETACRNAADQTQAGMTGEDIERLFKAECGRLGNDATYLVTAMTDLPTGVVVKGEPVMFDALSQYRNYHGDFGRTVVVGEPDPLLLRRAEALEAGWRAALDILRPGLSMKALESHVIEAVRDHGFPEYFMISAHNVGLQHTDDPVVIGLPHPFKQDRALECGMVINVDMPHDEAGWGSIHREDTVLITANGYEPLTQTDATLIVV